MASGIEHRVGNLLVSQTIDEKTSRDERWVLPPNYGSIRRVWL